MCSVISVKMDSPPANTKNRESTRSWPTRVRFFYSWAEGLETQRPRSKVCTARRLDLDHVGKKISALFRFVLNFQMYLPVCSILYKIVASFQSFDIFTSIEIKHGSYFSFLEILGSIHFGSIMVFYKNISETQI
jgi:hypothetical protein